MPLPIVHSGSILGLTDANNIYAIVGRLDPGLMLDVGAAAGLVTRKFLDASPQSRVIAFEPFPGNMRFLRERVGADPRVTIIEKAVSARSEGIGNLHVPFVASGYVRQLGGDGTGYSSHGMLVSSKDPRSKEKAIKVELTSIDATGSMSVS
jgi:FkbM family methyltransferase